MQLTSERHPCIRVPIHRRCINRRSLHENPRLERVAALSNNMLPVEQLIHLQHLLTLRGLARLAVHQGGLGLCGC